MKVSKAIVVASVLLCGAASVAVAVGAQDRPQAIPDRVASVIPGRQAPEWVSADQVLRGGELQRGLFDPIEVSKVETMLENGRSELERYRSAPEQGSPEDACISVVSFDGSGSSGTSTHDGLAEKSTGIYLGTVITERAGLLRGVPRALLRVRVDKVLLHGASGPALKTLLVAYPDVQMHLGDICVGAEGPRHPARPEVGQEVLVFSTTRVPVTGKVILTPTDDDIFFTLPDGTTSLPVHFGELLTPSGEPVSLKYVVQATEEAIETAEHGGA